MYVFVFLSPAVAAGIYVHSFNALIAREIWPSHFWMCVFLSLCSIWRLTKLLNAGGIRFLLLLISFLITSWKEMFSSFWKCSSFKILDRQSKMKKVRKCRVDRVSGDQA